MGKKANKLQGVVFNKDLPRHKCKKHCKSALYVIAYLALMFAVSGAFLYALLTPDH